MQRFKNQLRLIIPSRIKGYLLNWMQALFSPALVIVPSEQIAYHEDGLLLQGKNTDFLVNSRFSKAYSTGERTGSWKEDVIRWRIHTLCWAASYAVQLEGDFVECGVNKGGSALAVINYIDFDSSTKTFFLFDTYNGLVASDISEEERRLGIDLYEYEDCYEEVRAIFSQYQNVETIRGRIPDTLDQVNIRKVCYLHIDLNNATPEIAAGEYFWSRLVSGAIVVLDDYGFSKHYVQKQAWDAFALQHGLEVLTLPTGQGLMIKP